MQVNEMIAELDKEITRLQRAKELLAGSNVTSIATVRRKRHLTAEGRKRIADAQRRRWAKAHAQKKTA